MKKLIIPLLSMMVVLVVVSSLFFYFRIPNTLSSILGFNPGNESLGMYETPNGKIYELIQSGTGIYFKNGDGTLSQSYFSTNEIQKVLDEKNSMINQEWYDIFDRKYVISNYKGIHVTDFEGKDIGKSFTGITDALIYLESLNPEDICVTTLKNYIPESPTYENMNKEYIYVAKKYSNKNRIVKVVSPYKCEKGKIKIEGTEDKILHGKTGITYKMRDTLALVLEMARMGGFGFAGGEWGDTMGGELLDSKEIYVKNDNGLTQGKIFINTYSDNSSDIALDIGGISISKNGVTKNILKQVTEDLSYFAKNINIYPELPKNTKDIEWGSIMIFDGIQDMRETINKNYSFADTMTNELVLVDKNNQSIKVPINISGGKEKAIKMSFNGDMLNPLDNSANGINYRINYIQNKIVYWTVYGFKDQVIEKNGKPDEDSRMPTHTNTYEVVYKTDITSGATTISKVGIIQ